MKAGIEQTSGIARLDTPNDFPKGEKLTRVDPCPRGIVIPAFDSVVGAQVIGQSRSRKAKRRDQGSRDRKKNEE